MTTSGSMRLDDRNHTGVSRRFLPAESDRNSVKGSQKSENFRKSVFDQMDWSEDEISEAQQRHPQAADVLDRSVTLIHPTSDRMNTEFGYRSHCRKLLDRVANGEDTRPGTAAEVVITLCEVALASQQHRRRRSRHGPCRVPELGRACDLR
jgi:hypothetical protein